MSSYCSIVSRSSVSRPSVSVSRPSGSVSRPSLQPAVSVKPNLSSVKVAPSVAAAAITYEGKPKPSLAIPRTPTLRSGVLTTPVCVHCRNLGFKYDHWLRESPEPNSPVVCPVLLATECRYCHKVGHTVGSCPAKTQLRSTSAIQVPITYEGNPLNAQRVIPQTPTLPSASLMRRYGVLTTMASSLHANPYSVFDTSSDSGSDSGSITTASLPPPPPPHRRVDVGSLFVKSSSVTNVAPPRSKRLDVGSLFSPVKVADITATIANTIRHRRPFLELDEDGLHECVADYSTFYDPEVDRMVAERRALFTSGKSWADISSEDDEDN